MDDEKAEDSGFDPVALTLAVWLGSIVCVTGLIRLTEDASARAVSVHLEKAGSVGPAANEGSASRRAGSGV